MTDKPVPVLAETPDATLTVNELDLLAPSAFRAVLGQTGRVVVEMCDLIEQLPLSPRAIGLILADIRTARSQDDYIQNERYKVRHEEGVQGFLDTHPLGKDCDRARILQLSERLGARKDPVKEVAAPPKTESWGQQHASHDEGNHDYDEVAYDRDDRPISASCAYCGKSKDRCKGRKGVARPQYALRLGAPEKT